MCIKQLWGKPVAAFFCHLFCHNLDKGSYIEIRGSADAV